MFMFILTLIILKSERSLCQSDSEPNINDLTYRLYNRYNVNSSTITLNNNKETSLFIKGRSCVIITHGYNTNSDSDSVQDIVQAYLDSGWKGNIIAVDWGEKASGIYVVVVQRVPKVGATIGLFTVKLVDLGLCFPESIHLIGHSLGAHVMGVAGKKFQEVKGVNVSRCTGLDPAGPGYEDPVTREVLNTKSRLEADDADCVDVIHTCARKLGLARESGQVDFYPNNGGPFQPGCAIIDISCSHSRAYQFYAESVYNKNAFQATKCGSYNDYKANRCEANPTMFMGSRANCKIRGNFYLQTRSKSPFSLVDEN